MSRTSSKKYSNILILLIYRPKDGRKQNCLVQISGSSEKKELVKNNIKYLLLNTLSDNQEMTLKSSQRVWVIDKNLAWDNLIYLAVSRVEYLSQLIW
ncbi:4653_t:CDS:2, partial [Dentiscutata heterogama]